VTAVEALQYALNCIVRVQEALEDDEHDLAAMILEDLEQDLIVRLGKLTPEVADTADQEARWVTQVDRAVARRRAVVDQPAGQRSSVR